MKEEKRIRRQQELRRIDDFLLRLHGEHPWYALALAFAVAFVFCGCAWVLKVSVTAFVRWLVTVSR